MKPFARSTAAALLTVMTVLAPGLLLPGASTHAAPGAHGPNGEHLDAAAPGASDSATAPRFEARTETFELIGRLQGGELSILINRFETNEPVLDAAVELETGDVKAKASFHADIGDYAVDDTRFVEALSGPGAHPLVITVIAGPDTDLLEATLSVAAPAGQASDGPSHGAWSSGRTLYAALGLAALAALTSALVRRARRTPLSEKTR